LHPLHGHCKKEYQGEMRIESTIDSVTLRLFRHHRVIQQIVLPGASHIGLMAAGGLLAQDGRTDVCARDVLFLRPYLVPNAQTESPKGLHDGHAEMVHAQGQVDIQPACQDGGVVLCSGLWPLRCAEAATQALYTMFRTTGLFYGPRFRTVRTAFCCSTLSFAPLCINDTSERWESRCAVQPQLMDGAFHTVALMGAGQPESSQAPGLPFRIHHAQFCVGGVDAAFTCTRG
jgi:hypothetical protein